MVRKLILILACAVVVWPDHALGDVVTDWNKTIREVMQHDGVHADHHANPGWSTRTIAMMNGAMYDAFQSINRTHAPFLYTQKTTGASLEAAVHQAARDILVGCYTHAPEIQWVNDRYNERMAIVEASTPVDQVNKGKQLGAAIAAAYSANRATDNADSGATYTLQPGYGMWRPDPYMTPDQTAWGPVYGQVPTFAVRNSMGQANLEDQIALLPSLPGLGTTEYADAYNQVLNWGAKDVYGPANTMTSRTDDQTKIGIFWAYDRREMGPPPVLFVRNMEEIAAAVGNSPSDNARMFAMASVAQADAAIAAWDAKYINHFWRPVTAILEGENDGNASTMGDTDWRPLGAPGNIPDDGNPLTDADFKDDFTPPFPAWVSGHATMGAAVFKSLAAFYETNDFMEADASRIGDLVDTSFMLTSEEAASGGIRPYSKFWHEGELDVDSYAGSPDGENGISRVFLGLHWIMDQRDGLTLGHSIADYVADNYFQAVPEPSAIGLGLIATIAGSLIRRRKA